MGIFSIGVLMILVHKRLLRNKLSQETNHRGTEYTEREFLHQFWDIFLFGSL